MENTLLPDRLTAFFLLLCLVLDFVDGGGGAGSGSGGGGA